MRLLTVPFHADETPMSWVSRLAARNGVKARRLCGDLGMDFQAVVDGDGDTLRKAAALGRIDPGLLQANAFRKTVLPSGPWALMSAPWLRSSAITSLNCP